MDASFKKNKNKIKKMSQNDVVLDDRLKKKHFSMTTKKRKRTASSLGIFIEHFARVNCSFNDRFQRLQGSFDHPCSSVDPSPPPSKQASSTVSLEPRLSERTRVGS